MEKTVNPSDARGEQNIQKVLDLYNKMINQRQATLAVAELLDPGYIQHNPGIPTGAENLGLFFAQVASNRPLLKVEIYRIIAAGDYVWAHVNFKNLYNDEPSDRGIAGVDIYRFDNNGKIAEHWDVLQEIPDPKTASNTNTMF